MGKVRLIHWNRDEAEERASLLRKSGQDVDWEPPDGSSLRALRADPPSAVVIDLSRLPSQGRDVGLMIRRWKATRQVPLLFVGGAVEKVEGIRKLLPDAVYTGWGRIGLSLERALAKAPVHPVVPESNLAGYAGSPLPKKLGIKAGTEVFLAGAPEGFEELLGALPEGVVFRRRAPRSCRLVIWFARTRAEVERRVRRMGSLAGPGGLWIVWPKKAAGLPTDLNQAVVRKIGLASGLVDYKVCSVDATWTGLRFARRKPSPRREGKR